MPKEGRNKQALNRKEVKSEEMRLGSKEHALQNPEHDRWKRSNLRGTVTAQVLADIGTGLFLWRMWAVLGL